MKNYDELLAEFKEWVQTDKNVKKLWELNNKGNATYIHADMYAQGIARKWSQLLTDNYGTKASDWIKEYNNATQKGGFESIEDLAAEISKAYQKAYAESAYYAKNAQNGINAKNRIGMRAIEPKLDNDRLRNLFDKLIDTDTTEEMREHLISKKALDSIARSGVTDTIQANARLQSKAGLHAYVSRDASAGCCKWCDSIAGVYEYGTQPDDFWAVHGDCNCKFEYKPSRTAKTDYINFETSNGKMRKVTR